MEKDGHDLFRGIHKFDRRGRDTSMSNLPKQVEEDTSKIVLMPLYNVKLWSSLDNNSSNSFGGGARKENNRYTSVTIDEDQEMCDLVGDIVSDDKDTTVKD